ncbi:MAG: SagB/ThcOx family dehydrogenase [Candidatus Pacebacteria bacterium]|nr:SagB/ThcOx family dehydrogenase [Candidatus Paceibacterota bacterium]
MKFRALHTATTIEAIQGVRFTVEAPAPSRKEYPRFPTTELPTPAHIDVPMSDALHKRVSKREYDAAVPLSLQHCSSLLFACAGIVQHNDATPHRTYPSGGALQPIEHYLIAYRVDGVAPGIYHYNPGTHSLSKLPFEEGIETLPPAWEKTSPIRNPAAIIVLTAVWGRAYPKYGDFCYRLALAEAGHSAQNALLAAAALNIGACPIMGFDAAACSRALDIAQDTEDPLYLVCLGA